MARGNFGNPEQHRKAGKAAHRQRPDLAQRAGEKGGETTARRHDQEFYEEIGEQGAEAQPREAKVKGGQHSHGGGRDS